MAMPQRDEKIEAIKRLDALLEYAVMHNDEAKAVLRDGARSVKGDTLLLIDPMEIRKEFSYKMEFVTRVRDASRSSKEGRDVLVSGRHRQSSRRPGDPAPAGLCRTP